MRIPAAVALVACLVVAQDAPKAPAAPYLDFLVRSQLPAGTWPGATADADIGATAKVLVALLGTGRTGGPEPAGAAVEKGLQALAQHQSAAGAFTADPGEHLLATLALCEHLAMSSSPRWKTAAQRAVLRLVALQNDDGSFGDLVSTAWAGRAIAAAQAGGLSVDPKAVERLLGWVKGLDVTAPREAAVALMLRPLIGKEDARGAALAPFAAVCLTRLPEASGADEAYCVFATQGIFARGGAEWRKWSESLKKVLDACKADGSWDPTAAEVDGRVGATALRTVCAAVYYHYDRVFGEQVPGETVVGIGGGAGGGFRGRGGRRVLRAAGGGSAAPGFNTESYDRIVSEGFRNVWDTDVSTFSVDVDTASYANVRRFLAQQGKLPPKDAVRVEEMVNYFTYSYAGPDARSPHPFSIHVETASCPWKPEHRLVRVGLQAARLLERDRPAGNLVFLLDVSGSMKAENKLPLLQRALGLLVERLDARDTVSIVVYAGAAGLVLPPTRGNDHATILAALDKLQAGGSTNGGAGIELAYATARAGLVAGGVNRVILCTDGDFNVGISDRGALTRRIEEEAKSGVALSILGFGMGNLKDARLEEMSNKGDGNYAYIDTLNEARKVLVEQLMGTLLTLAKDAKVQVFFNPATVASWRLIGYENRLLKKEDFNDDRKDAGDIGAGHSVTALYEIVPAGGDAEPPKADDNPFLTRPRATDEAARGALLRLRLRYKPPGAETSVLQESDVFDDGGGFDRAGEDFRWAASAALFGMLLRGDEHLAGATYGLCEEIACTAVGDDPGGYRKEMVELVARAKGLAAAAAGEG